MSASSQRARNRSLEAKKNPAHARARTVPRASSPARRAGSIPARTGSTFEFVILAGGLSQRMGHDKSRLRLGRFTLVGHLRRLLAHESGVSLRVIRQDAIARCGPLGGIFTALSRTRADAVIILACDMPFLPKPWLTRLRKSFLQQQSPLFTKCENQIGFPMVIPRRALPQVEQQVSTGDVSLRTLAAVLRAKTRSVPLRQAWQFQNVNTPEDWEKARRRWASGRGR